MSIFQLKSVWFLLIACFSSINLHCQNQIPPPQLDYNNGILSISYNLKNLEQDYYHINLEVKDDADNIFNPNSLRGDIGKYIKKGKNREIYWDLNADNINTSGDIYTRIIATPSPKVNKAKLIFYSTLFPGAGQANFYQNKTFWLLGAAGIGSVVGAVTFNQLSDQTRQSYIEAEQHDSELYDQYNRQENLKVTLAYTAVGIWVANIIWTAMIPKTRDYNSNINIGFTPIQNGDNVSAGLMVGLKFKNQ